MKKTSLHFRFSSLTAVPLMLICLMGRGTCVSAADIFSDTSFFPISVWLQSPSNASAYKNAGINLYIGLWEGPTKDDLDQLKSSGMPVLCDQNEFALANISTYKDIIAGWLHGDEPDNAQDDGNGGYGPCISPDTIIKKYTDWKAKSPQLPILLNLGQGVSNIDYIGRGSACHSRTDMYPKYIQGCDIACFDIYPVNSSYAAIKGNLWYVAKGIDSLRMWCDDKKPAWCWIECTRIDSSSSAAPTPDQVKAEVWMALIHGARGFGYFCHSWYGGFEESAWLSNTPMKTAITALNARISALAPVLNSPSVPGAVTAASDAASVPIDIMVKNRSGSLYLFAVAMRNGAAKGSFAIAGLTAATTIEVLDENRSITAIDGKFQDNFTGYGVHLYKINAALGIVDRRPPAAYRSGGSCRLIAAVQSKGVFFSAPFKNKESIMIYSLQGKFIKTLSKAGAGFFKIPDGVYFIRRN